MKKKTYIKPKLTVSKLPFQFFFTRGLNPLNYEMLLGATGPGGGTGGGCFLPGTHITLGDGTAKVIEKLTNGEKVLSYNTETAQTVVTTIAKCIHHTFDKGYIFINNQLKATPEHPIWTNNLEWKPAEKLINGDFLLNPKGERIQVTTLERVPGAYEVYNFEVDSKEHNYFAENILVHNVAKVFGDTIRNA